VTFNDERTDALQAILCRVAIEGRWSHSSGVNVVQRRATEAL
jgi:hypothetical protein